MVVVVSSSASSSLLLFREPIHIIGAGSIGLLWATSIRSKYPNYPLTVLLRDSHRRRKKVQQDWNKQQQHEGNNNNNNNNNNNRQDQHSPRMEVLLTATYPSSSSSTTITTGSNKSSTTTQQPQLFSLPVDFVTTTDDVTSSPSTSSSSSTSFSSRIQNLIVTTKSYQAVDAVKSVLPRLFMTQPSVSLSSSDDDNDDCPSSSSSSSPSKVIVLCNGALSVRDELSKLLQENVPISPTTISPFSSSTDQQPPLLILATTTHGAYREMSQLVVDDDENDNNSSEDPFIQRLTHAGYGTTFIEEGPPIIVPKRAETTTATTSISGNDHQGGKINNHDDTYYYYYGQHMGTLWDDVGLNCSILSSQKMEELLWKKLAANCVINPLTAIFRCTNGELLLQPSFPELQHNILLEVANVMIKSRMVQSQQQHHQQQQQQKHDHNRDNLGLDEAGRGSSSSNDDTTLLLLLVSSLREFVAQVIMDTKHNKSSMYQDVCKNVKTEIDHINGYIVRKGAEYGLDCVTNDDLCQRIKELEASYNNTSQ